MKKTPIALITVFLFSIFAFCSLSFGETPSDSITWHVDDDAGEMQDGSLDYPFDNIQQAINTSLDGDIVLVIDGIYIGDGNRDISYYGKAITVQSQNGPDNCIIDCQASKEDQHRAFNFNSNEGLTSTVEGFTITNGYNDHVGGIYLWNGSSPNIKNCHFIGNSALYGAAIGIGGNSSPLIYKCIFLGNSAHDGGAINIYQNGNPIIVNSKFLGNTVIGRGGAIQAYSANLLIINSFFSGNESQTGGALWIRGCISNITNCTVINNTAQTDSGIYIDLGATDLVNCILWSTGDNLKPLVFNPRYVLNISNSCIEGYDGSFDESGIVSGNPFLLDSDGADDIIGTIDDCPELMLDSPCIDTGDYELYALSETDLDNDGVADEDVSFDVSGNERIVNGKIDMGAAEKQAPVFIVETSTVIVSEGDSESFTVRLKDDPGGQVNAEVKVVSGDGDIRVLSGNILSFDSTNYQDGLPVLMEIAEDTDHLNGTCTVRISASGFLKYDISVIESDNEPSKSILYVDCNAQGQNNGSSWSGALRSLSEAMQIAGEYPQFEEIRVAQGTYLPSESSNREESFELVNGVSLKGGYAGALKSDPVERDFRNYLTKLSGDLNGDDTGDHDDPSRAENSYHVITGKDIELPIVIEGLTIASGNAFGPNPHHGKGAGMDVVNSVVTVRDCLLEDNSSGYGGAGIKNEGGTLNVVNCSFLNNKTLNSAGAGLYSQTGEVVISNCVFRDNASRVGGGYYGYRTNSIINNCLFNNNSSTDKGGAVFNQYDTCIYSNCTFANNSSEKAGGAYCYSSQVTLNNSILWANSDNNGTEESAQITVDNGTALFNSCCIQDWTDELEGYDVISVNPMFADPQSGDFTLQLNSLCMDSGNDDLLPSDILDADNDGGFEETCPIDLTGQKRVMNRSVDMGAYEYQGIAFLTEPRKVVVPEGFTAEMQLWLNTDPQGQVEVSITHSDGDSDITVLTGTLTFDSSDYSVPKKVEFSAASDSDSLNGAASILIRGDGYLDTIIKVVENDSTPVPEVIYVDKAAKGGNFGSTWNDAFIDLQVALSTVKEYPGIKEIRVAQGVYTPTNDPTDRKASFELIGGLTIKGGYAGSSSINPDARDIKAFITTLSGDLSGNDEQVASPLDIGEDPLRAENSYHVIIVNDTDQPAVLDGFIVIGGNANDDSFHNLECGGGLYINNELAKCSIVDCVFQYNYSLYSGGAASLRDCEVSFKGCQFFNNTSSDYSGALSSRSCSINMSNCLIINNYSNDSYAVWDSVIDSIKLNHCTFFNNYGETHAGCISLKSTSIEVDNCILWGNASGEILNNSLFPVNSSTCSVNYSCVQGWSEDDGGKGNHSNHPLLYNAEDSKCLLLPWSACIDAGDPNSPYDNEPLANGSRVNMGFHGNTALAAKTDGSLFADNLTVIKKERVDRAKFRYTLELSLPNMTDRKITEVHVKLTETTDGAAVIIDDEIYFPEVTPQSIAQGSSVEDYFVIEIDYSQEFSEDNFKWIVKSALSGRDIYVDKSAQGDDNGQTWEDAFECLQDAIFAAEYGDRILVAQGTYTPDQGKFQIAGDKEATFMIKYGVQLLGGYAGVEGANPSERDTKRYVTVLSGDLDNDDLFDMSNYENNSYSVVTVNGMNPNSSIDGFVISGGNGGTDFPYQGGAIYIYDSNFKISNCIIERNFSKDGSAVYCIEANLDISDSIVRNNSNQHDGAGIYSRSSIVRLSRCQFYNNSGGTGAAICSRLYFAYSSAGAIYIDKCIFEGNISTGSGGSINIYDGSFLIANSIFKDNTALVGGAIRTHADQGTSEIINCVFYNNNARDKGGAIYCYMTETEIINCTIFNNSCDTSSAGGIYNGKCVPLISNCILWGNRNSDGIDQSSQIQSDDILYNPVINYSCVEGWTGSLGGVGNIGDTPLFVHDDEIGQNDTNLRLSPNSPCIDSGDNSALPEGITYDLDDSYRYYDKLNIDDSGNGSSPVIDIGAYENNLGLPIAGILSPEIYFDTYDDKAAPDSQVIKIRNRGGGLLEWNLHKDCDWLELSSISGISDGNVNEVAVSVDVSGLEFGKYECEIEVLCPGAVVESRFIKVFFKHGHILNVPSEYSTIQSAINSSASGDTVVVAPGIYVGQGNRNINFSNKGIKIRSVDPNDPETVAQTIIDCQEEAGGFKFISGEDQNSILSGMSIINADESCAIYIKDAGPAIINCTLRNNNSYAVYCEDGYALIKGCNITENSYIGIFAKKRYTPTHVDIQDCSISKNISPSRGGICLANYVTATLKNCRIFDNVAEYGGGGLYIGKCSTEISNCAIYNNSTNANGGGLSIFEYSNVKIQNCVIANNSAEQSGGGLYLDGTGVDIINTVVWGNTSDQISGQNATVSFSTIQGGYDGICNIKSNPYFVSAAKGDFRLNRLSHCIATGDPRYDNNDEPGPNGGRINMGIYGGTDLAATITDTDSDGMPDSWEKAFLLSYRTDDSNDDKDSDTITNINEYILGTDPLNADSDHDGMPDKWEVNYKLNPIGNDSELDKDEDGLNNLDEFSHNCDPTNHDSDNDSMPDGWEVDFELNPTSDDSAGDIDDDGLANADEYMNACDPQDNDTDDDGLDDNSEIVVYKTNPKLNDTDEDGLLDGEEINITNTNPLSIDTDGDSMDDQWEVTAGLNPLADDSESDNDNDGLTNIEEYSLGTYPHKKDTDRDGIPDGLEVEYALDPVTDDSMNDLDGDGFSNIVEFVHNTDPNETTLTIDPITILVPEMVEYIQPAINAAIDGETIIVSDGVYAGYNNINLNITKPVTLRSANGPENCIIDCQGPRYSCGITVYNDMCIVKGFQIRYANDMAIVCYDSSPMISNCVLVDNLIGGIELSNSSATIYSCQIRTGGISFNSLAETAGKGIDAHGGGTPTISNCVISDNNSTGIYLHYTDGAIISDCVISSNVNSGSYQVGAIYCKGDHSASYPLIISNTTIVKNNAAAVSFEGIDVQVRNSIIWNNGYSFSSQDYSGLVVENSVVQDGWNGEGNLDVDPMLTPDGHLTKGSVCIDYGPEQTEPADQNDIDGDPRYVGRLDIGADEFVDTDEDGLPDWWELKYFGSAVDGAAQLDDDDDSMTNIDEYNLLSTDPFSRIIFVDISRPDDSGDGLTLESAKKTIKGAIEIASENDTIKLLDGVYTGESNCQNSISRKPISICSLNGPENCIVDSEGNSYGFAFSGSYGRSSGYMIKGITVRNAESQCIKTNGADLLMINCVVQGSSGDGIKVDGASPVIIDCTIESNTGSGVLIYQGSSAVIDNCMIRNNQQKGIAHGGHLLKVSNSSIMSNGREGISGSGYSIFSNCLITGHTNSSGLSLAKGNYRVNNCTVASNRYGVMLSSSYGSVSEIEVSNSILWNISTQIGSYFGNLDQWDISCSYSNIKGGWDGEGNIDADPLFADPEEYDYHLKSAGGRWKEDLYDVCDVVPDGYVNFADFSILSQYWLMTDNGVIADFDFDNTVGLSDLAIFAGKYLMVYDPDDWIYDQETSPCIDAGNPIDSYSSELLPNGNRVNIGAYGATSEASKTE